MATWCRPWTTDWSAGCMRSGMDCSEALGRPVAAEDALEAPADLADGRVGLDRAQDGGQEIGAAARGLLERAQGAVDAHAVALGAHPPERGQHLGARLVRGPEELGLALLGLEAVDAHHHALPGLDRALRGQGR